MIEVFLFYSAYYYQMFAYTIRYYKICRKKEMENIHAACKVNEPHWNECFCSAITSHKICIYYVVKMSTWKFCTNSVQWNSMQKCYVTTINHPKWRSILICSIFFLFCFSWLSTELKLPLIWYQLVVCFLFELRSHLCIYGHKILCKIVHFYIIAIYSIGRRRHFFLHTIFYVYVI